MNRQARRASAARLRGTGLGIRLHDRVLVRAGYIDEDGLARVEFAEPAPGKAVGAIHGYVIVRIDQGREPAEVPKPPPDQPCVLFMKVLPQDVEVCPS